MVRFADASTPVVEGSTDSDSSSSPHGLAAIVLLTGSVRQTALGRTAARSRFDLPLLGGQTIGSRWLRAVTGMREALSNPCLPVIIAANQAAKAPDVTGTWPLTSVVMDVEEPRGTGGALRDVVLRFPATAEILVVPGHSIPPDPDLFRTSAMTTQALAADAAVYATRDGEPTGIFRFRCGALATLPARGFVDMKEQGLPSLASRFDVRVITTDDPAPISIRTLDAYIEALRWLANGKTKTHHGPSEDWRCTFSLIEPGAEVHPTARVHDSVVLAGSKVGRDAVVVRSLVGPAGVVGAGRSAFDELVGDPEAE